MFSKFFLSTFFENFLDPFLEINNQMVKRDYWLSKKYFSPVALNKYWHTEIHKMKCVKKYNTISFKYCQMILITINISYEIKIQFILPLFLNFKIDLVIELHRRDRYRICAVIATYPILYLTVRISSYYLKIIFHSWICLSHFQHIKTYASIWKINDINADLVPNSPQNIECIINWYD